MLQFFLILFLILTLFRLQDVISQDIANDIFKKYESSSSNFKILFPATWNESTHDPHTYENPTPYFLANFSAEIEEFPLSFVVKVRNLTATDEMSSYNYDAVRRIQESYSNFKLIKSGTSFSLSNLSAYNLEYSYLNGNGELIRSLQTWASNDGKIYTFVYSAKADEYEKHLPTIQLMLSSFSVD